MPEQTRKNVDHRHSVEIINRSAMPMTLHVEPWGFEYELQPMDRIQVNIIGPIRQAIPI